MNKDKIKASLIPYISAFLAGFSILACQYIAVSLGQQKPYPAVTISTTSKHYPQYIIFRLGTISNSVLLIMSWYLNYCSLNQLYPKVNRYLPHISLIFGSLGGFALMCSTSLLDTGDYKNHLHVLCAVIFFVFTSFACIYNTIISLIIQYHTKKFSWYNLTAKIILTIIIMIWVYGAFEYKGPIQHFQVIDEYNLTFSLLIYFIILGRDMRHYELIYKLTDYNLQLK